MNEIFNKETEVILDELDIFSGGRLLNKEDISRLISIAKKNDQTGLLEDMAFTGKFLSGLLSIIKRGENAVNEQVFYNYTKEYTQNLEKLRSDLNKLLESGSSFVKKIFQEKYLEINQDSVNNLTNLCSDLNWLKMYLNENSK